MQLGPKDLVATIAAAIAGYLGWVALKGATYPWHMGHRWAVVIIFAAGMASCIAFSPKTAPSMSNPMTMTMAIMGGLAALVAIICLIAPKPVLVEVTAGIIVLMWFVATIKHLVS